MAEFESAAVAAFNQLADELDTHGEALVHGRGGRELVARATGLGRNTVLDGKKKVRSSKQLRAGAGLIRDRAIATC